MGQPETVLQVLYRSFYLIFHLPLLLLSCSLFHKCSKRTTHLSPCERSSKLPMLQVPSISVFFYSQIINILYFAEHIQGCELFQVSSPSFALPTPPAFPSIVFLFQMLLYDARWVKSHLIWASESRYAWNDSVNQVCKMAKNHWDGSVSQGIE